MYYILVTITKNIYESDVSRETFGYIPYNDFSLKINLLRLLEIVSIGMDVFRSIY